MQVRSQTAQIDKLRFMLFYRLINIHWVLALLVEDLLVDTLLIKACSKVLKTSACMGFAFVHGGQVGHDDAGNSHRQRGGVNKIVVGKVQLQAGHKILLMMRLLKVYAICPRPEFGAAL